MKIRVIKTASKANAVQVVRYQNNKRVVLQHIGSAHTTEALSDLLILAEEWIKDYNGQLPATARLYRVDFQPCYCAFASH